MNFTIPQKIIQSLDNIRFYERYKDVVEKNRIDADCDYDKDQILLFLKNLGYASKFISQGSFFKCSIKKNAFDFELNICLEHSCVELVLVVYENKELLVGDPWGVIIQYLYLDNETKIPIYRDLTSLKQIIESSLEIFSDFVNDLALQNNGSN